MGQGLTGAPGTYTRLMDIVMGPIPNPDEEPALGEGPVAFEYFMDDDQGGAETFEELVQFLHERYFLRMSWAKLTLNPKKTKFFRTKIGILGHECTRAYFGILSG